MAQSSGEVGETLTSEELRAQIEQTRADISETIDAIQSRLSPAQLMTDAKDRVTTPIAAAVGAIAITALAVRLLTRRRSRVRVRSRTPVFRGGRARRTGTRGQALAAAAACTGLAWALQCSGNAILPINRGFRVVEE